MPGVRITAGADLQIPAGSLRIRVTETGEFEADPLVLHLRTDMWPYWLEEAVDAAVSAQLHAGRVLANTDDEDATTRAMIDELRCSMRAITSAAFAVDGFYAAVKARAGAHPHEEVWQRRRTPRHTQVFETLRHHLKMRNPGATDTQKWIKELFRFRGWAVHPGSRFRAPVYRSDLDAMADWHFSAFRAENAVNSARVAVNALDVMVACIHRASGDLKAHHPTARNAMNQVLDAYDLTPLPAVERAEDPLDVSTDGVADVQPG